MLYNEIQCLRELYFCENIISLECVYRAKDKIALVMKFAKDGSLRSCINKQQAFSEAEIRQIMEQLLLAVDLMHRHNIYHRDIKPDNILIIDKKSLHVCIADLGLACRATDEKGLKLKCGTPGYLDPEVLKGQQYTAKSDIFSLGSLLFNVITGS